MDASDFSTLAWGTVDLDRYPNMVAPPPGPKSNEYHSRCTKYFKGLSGQVKLMPVAFESGEGCVLRDVDGNEYIDFSSGIYVTTLGHCHPKISEAIAKHARTLMNAHDFVTPIKMALCEKLPEILPGDLSGFQFYDAGTAAVEAGLRILRAASGKNENSQLLPRFSRKNPGSGVARTHPRPLLWRDARAGYAYGAPPGHLSARVDEGGWLHRHGQVHRILRRVHRQGHGTRCSRILPGADPRVGRIHHASGRFLSETPQVLR